VEVRVEVGLGIGVGKPECVLIATPAPLIPINIMTPNRAIAPLRVYPNRVSGRNPKKASVIAPSKIPAAKCRMNTTSPSGQ